MSSENEERQSYRSTEWTVQPLWVKVLTVCVAIPAWIVLIADMGGRFETPALIAFGAVVALQAVFAFRAYWRMDL